MRQKSLDLDYSPPWRVILRRNHRGWPVYGPWYGPEHQDEYDQALREWSESLAGGGLWDRREDRDVQWRKEFQGCYLLLTHPRERLVAELYFDDCLSLREIAWTTQSTPEAVRQVVYRVRKKVLDK